MHTREHANGTSITTQTTWSGYVRARALCPDGKVRATTRLGPSADTFFSVPAAVKAHGRTVSGFITIGDDDAVVFTPTGKNADLVKEAA